MERIFGLVLVLLFSLVSCKPGNDKNSSTKTQQEEVVEVKKPIPPKSEGPIRVLFVGNSHTEFYVSYPELLKALVKENDKSVEVLTLLEMGVSIDKILSSNKSKADKLFSLEDNDGNYFDYIILQESSPVAMMDLAKYKWNCKSLYNLASKQSPDVAVYIYELVSPFDRKDLKFALYQKKLLSNALEVAQSLPNAGVLKFASVIRSAYAGNEGYSAKKDGVDLLRYTDNSFHILNDAAFLNSIFLYKTLFDETPKIPQKLPLATGTDDSDSIELLEVESVISNPKFIIYWDAEYDIERKELETILFLFFSDGFEEHFTKKHSVWSDYTEGCIAFKEWGQNTFAIWQYNGDLPQQK